MFVPGGFCDGGSDLLLATTICASLKRGPPHRRSSISSGPPKSQMALRRPSRGPFQATKAASTLSQRRRRPSHRLSRQQRQKPASLRVHFPLPRRLDPVVADRAPTPVAFLTFSHHCPDRYPIRPRSRLILAMAAPAPGSLGGPQVALNPPRNDPISKARSIAIDVVL